MKVETQAWLTKAREDFRAATLLFDAELTDAACYHCQQAAEKGLKAILEERDHSILRTHDLDVLIDQIPSSDAVPDGVTLAAAFLSAFAVEVRYPGTETDVDDAKEALAMATVIMDWVTSVIA